MPTFFCPDLCLAKIINPLQVAGLFFFIFSQILPPIPPHKEQGVG